MSTADLPRYEKPACASCHAFAPECHVPIGDGAAAVCWLCAHAIADHGAELGAPLVACGCAHEEIYPADVLSRRSSPALKPVPLQSHVYVEPLPVVAPWMRTARATASRRGIHG